MKRAEEIGISVGTGLSRVRHRSDTYIDKKSRPKDEMPDWWISSNWVAPSSDSDDEEDEEDEVNYDDDNNNVHDHVRDNDRDDHDGNDHVTEITAA